MAKDPKAADTSVEDGVDAVEATISPEIQNRIGQQLQKIYHDFVNQPLPDRFSKLLSELAASDSKPRSDAND